MPEYDALNPNMDAIHQVKYSGELIGMNPAVALQRAHQALDYVGLGEQRYESFIFFNWNETSHEVGLCTYYDPQLIIADEPSNGLDAKAREFMLNTLEITVNEGQRSVLMASHLMDDVERVCENIVLLHKGKLAAQGKIEDLKAIDKEVEIHVWGSPGKMEETLIDRGMKVRREGRVMRIGHNGDDTYNNILKAAADVGTQVRRMHDHEGTLEDLFLVIMEELGHDVKSSEDLLGGV